jgi:hypothetical protein
VRRILGRPTAESETGAGWLPLFLILAVVAPALSATLQSAARSVTPVQIAQAPPVPPQQSTPVAVAVAQTEPAQAVPVAVAITEAPQTNASAVRPQTAQSAQAAAEVQRVEEDLKRLAEQQRETMTKQFELAIAANETQSKAQIDELRAKLKGLQSEYERAKRMADAGLASEDGVRMFQQAIEQVQREMQTVEANRNLELSRLMLDRAQAQQKRDYDQLLEQYAKLQGYPREKIRATGDLKLDVVDAEVRPEAVTDPSATARAGDTVDVIVSGEAELPEFSVEPDGTIRLPFIGSIEVKGLTTRQIAEAVAKRLTDRKLATNPQVSVTLRRR